MFTGIVAAVGTIASIEGHSKSERSIWVSCPFSDVSLGESIAINGVCLTAVAIKPAAGPASGHGAIEFFVSSETTARSNLGALQAGDGVNLERALRLSDRLSGHLVQGHVDGLARLVQIEAVGDSRDLVVELPSSAKKLVIEKGSITLDGISLTINQIRGTQIRLRIIPHTWEHTNLKLKRVGQDFNFELDMVAKYIQRLVQNDAHDS